MYEVIRGIHNILRWLVVLAALYALVKAYAGIIGRSVWTKSDQSAGLIFTSILNLQFLVGLILYGVSPLTRTAMRDMGAAMGSDELRFFAVEHVILMLLAVIIAQVGYTVSKRAPSDRAKFVRAAVSYTLSVVLIAIAIPWWRPLLPTYWG
ncbi:MAG TPA: hypothetical protein VF171_08950 [Trueperaceae bacterium]